MRLDGVPSTNSGGSSPGGADLIVKYDDMGEIGHAAFLLRQHLSSAGKHAQAHTEAAAKSLANTGFDMGTALTKAGEGWQGQLQLLLDACAQISNHLDYSVKSSKQEDHFVAARMEASKISEYLDVPSPASAPKGRPVPKADGPVI